jgi:hypothetical protein
MFLPILAVRTTLWVTNDDWSRLLHVRSYAAGAKKPAASEQGTDRAGQAATRLQTSFS